MAQGTSRVKYTYSDFVLFPDDGRRHELIDGAHVVTPSPSMRHQHVVTQLLLELGLYFRETQLGRVFPAPCDVVLSQFDVVEPDLVVVGRRNADRVTEAHIRGAPDLVVEILSPSTERRDRGPKRELYEKFGVHEYWIVDPVAKTVDVLRLADGELVLADSPAGNETLTSPLFPGLEVRLSSVFTEP